MPFEAILFGATDNDGTGDYPRTVAQKLNRMLKEVFDGFARIGHTHPSTQISDATVSGRALLTAPDAASQRTTLDIRAIHKLTDLDDVATTAPINGQELRHNGLNWENRDPVAPQQVVAQGSPRLSRGVHHDGTVTLLPGTGVSVTINGADVGDGFRVTVRNRMGLPWTVPPFSGMTLEFENNAAHTAIPNGKSATLETYSRGGTRYVAITGATA